MALTRGTNGHFPCPRCLVPKEEQSDLSKLYKLRTADDSKALVMRALKEKSATKQDLITKTQSLRPVVVCIPSVLSVHQF